MYCLAHTRPAVILSNTLAHTSQFQRLEYHALQSITKHVINLYSSKHRAKILLPTAGTTCGRTPLRSHTIHLPYSRDPSPHNLPPSKLTPPLPTTSTAHTAQHAAPHTAQHAHRRLPTVVGYHQQRMHTHESCRLYMHVPHVCDDTISLVRVKIAASDPAQRNKQACPPENEVSTGVTVDRHCRCLPISATATRRVSASPGKFHASRIPCNARHR